MKLRVLTYGGITDVHIQCSGFTLLQCLLPHNYQNLPPSIMKTSSYLTLLLAAANFALPAGAAEINSIFQGSIFEPWSIASNWSPSGVPDNGNGNTYNVTIGSESTFQSVDLDIDVTVDNVDSYSGFFATDHSLTVLETTNLRGQGLKLTAENADMDWTLGDLLDFSNGSLPGDYWLRADPGRELTVRFNGANITTNTGFIQLRGVGVNFVDENGLSALRNLTRNEKTLTLREGVSLTTTGALTNTGSLQVGYGGGALTVNGDLISPGGITLLASDVFDPEDSSVEVTVNGSLTTGPDARISIGGAETIPASLIVHGSFDGLEGTLFTSSVSAGGTFQFDDALITENAGSLRIGTPDGKIIDQHGSNAITNLVRNHEGAEFGVYSGKKLTLPGGFRNEGTFEIQSTANPGINDTEVTVSGDLTNSGLIELIAATRAAHIEVLGDMNNSGSFQINTRGVMPGSGRITGELTNSGSIGAQTGLNAPSALLEIGSLANLSGTVLTGGQYVVFCPQFGVATLRVPGANIVTNRAYIYMSGADGLFDDGTGNSALRNLMVNDTDGTLAFDNGKNVITGPTFTNNGSILINYLDSRILTSASVTIPGNLTNFSNKTLTGGSYALRADGPTRAATLRFDRADIVTNAASLQLYGEGARILDENDLDGLRNFAVNTSTGTLSTDQNFTTAGNFRNDGLIEVYSFGVFGDEVTFKVTGQLENYSAGTLTGGFYFLRGDSRGARLQFTGADIVTNAATITLVREGAIVDENEQDGLRNLAANQEYLGLDEHDLLLKGNFTNSGTVYINNCDLSLPAGGVYTQTAGSTWLDDQGIIAPGGVQIEGGRLSGEGRIKGNLTLSADAELEFDLSQEDRFEIQGEVNLGGSTLRIVLPEGFSIAPDETIAALTSSVGFSGTFSNVADGQRLLSADETGSFLVSYPPGTDSIVLSEFRMESPPAFTTVSLAGDTLTLAWEAFGDATNYSVQTSSVPAGGSWSTVAEITDGSTSSQISLPAGPGPAFIRVISP